MNARRLIVFCLACGLFLLCLLPAMQGRPLPLVALSVVIFALFPILHFRAAGWTRLFDRKTFRHDEEPPESLAPAFWLSGAYAVFFGWGVLRLVWIDPTRHLELLLLTLAGNAALQTGLGLRMPERERTFTETPESRSPATRWLLSVWLILGLGLAAVYFIRMGGLPWLAEQPESARVFLGDRGGGVLRVGVYSLIVWCFFAWRDFLYERHFANRLRFVGLAAVALVFVLLGNRAPLLTIGGVGGLMHLARFEKDPGRIRKRLASYAALALFMGLAFGVWGALRIAGDEQVRRYPEVRSHLEEDGFLGLAFRQLGDYLGRGAENFSVVLEGVPRRYPFRYGGAYLDPLWTAAPGKQYNLDMQLKRAFGMDFPGGGFVPSMLGEAYVNFGVFGIPAIPFFVALFLSWLYRKWRASPRGAVGLLYPYFLYLFCVHMVSGYLASSVFPYEAVLLIVLGDRFTKWKRKRA